jgi:hypothetical protein
MAKEANTMSLVYSVIDFETSHGHLRWKISDLARRAKVSRALVYYHLGRTKIDILGKSVRIIGELYCGLSVERIELLKRGEVLECIRQSRKVLARSPASLVFYLNWRTRQGSPFQKVLIEFENRYQAKLLETFPNLSKTEATALQSFLHGLTTSPVLTEDSLRTAVDWMAPVFRHSLKLP